MEHYIIHTYLLSAIETSSICDQFALRPTGSTTVALVFTNHHYDRLLETNDYVRCLLIDFCKAFDTNCHIKLVEKLKWLHIPRFIINRIIYFLTHRTQSVVINGKQTLRLFITRSIVRRSGLRPFLFLIYILDLCPLSFINTMCKYVDDQSQLCPQHSYVPLKEEYAHIQEWAHVNKLCINI